MIRIIKQVDRRIAVLELKNDKMTIILTNYGCTLIKWLTADRYGNFEDIILGYDDINDYMVKDGYLGALVGRTANRIGQGRFQLNGRTYHLPVNNGPNSLHGGIRGFSYQIFDYCLSGDNEIEFTYYSKDGEEGYPGNLTLKVTYTLIDDTLTMRYRARCDQDTLINITNHAYFNLSGMKQPILDHHLLVKSSCYAAIDQEGLPDGRIIKSAKTAFDFQNMTPIEERLKMSDEQLERGCGFDHPFIFDQDHDQIILYHPLSGRRLTLDTTLPMAHIYTGNYLDGRIGKGGIAYPSRYGICLETEYMPDAINLGFKPDGVLCQGDEYDERTSYKMEVMADEC